VRAPGVAPPGVPRFGALLVGATLVTAAVLIALGVRDHGRPGWHFYEARAGAFVSAALLVASAAVAARIAARVGARGGRRFWIAAAVGFLFLAYDELGVVHEGVDKWLHRRFGWPDDHPVTDRIDTAIVALYGVVALAWAYRHRGALLRLRWATRLTALAFAGFVVMETLDALANWTAVEESLKLVTEALIVTALVAAARDPGLAERPSGGVYFSRL
jgi:hypothetical protein